MQLVYSLFLSTKYATASSPAIANTASTPGILRFEELGLGVGEGVGAGAEGVGVAVRAGVGDGEVKGEGDSVGEGEGEGVGVGEGEGEGVGVGVGVVSGASSPSSSSDDGVGVGDGLGVGVGVCSSDTTSTLFSIPPALIKNSPSGTPSVFISSVKSPFESAMTLIEVATFRFTEVASSAASPDIAISFLPVISNVTGPIDTGNEIEKLTTPVSSIDSSRGRVIVPPGNVIVIVCPEQVIVTVCKNTGDNETRIFFMFSAVTENTFSPLGKSMPIKSRVYLSFETGREIANEDFNHTSSFGDAFPDIDNVSPCTTQGGTVNSVTSALEIVTEAIPMNAQSTNRPTHDTNWVCFIFISTTPDQFIILIIILI